MCKHNSYTVCNHSLSNCSQASKIQNQFMHVFSSDLSALDISRYLGIWIASNTNVTVLLMFLQPSVWLLSGPKIYFFGKVRPQWKPTINLIPTLVKVNRFLIFGWILFLYFLFSFRMHAFFITTCVFISFLWISQDDDLICASRLTLTPFKMLIGFWWDPCRADSPTLGSRRRRITIIKS